jgi:hypothetical protein
MYHHDNVSITAERFVVTRLLIATVSSVTGVLNDGYAKGFCHRNSVIGRTVVNEQDVINDRPIDICQCAFKSLCRLVCWKHHDNALT